MKLTCNTPHDARTASEYSYYSGLFGMDVILASEPRRVTSKSSSFTNCNNTASKGFCWLFKLELHTGITVPGLIGDVRGRRGLGRAVDCFDCQFASWWYRRISASGAQTFSAHRQHRASAVPFRPSAVRRISCWTTDCVPLATSGEIPFGVRPGMASGSARASSGNGCICCDAQRGARRVASGMRSRGDRHVGCRR